MIMKGWARCAKPKIFNDETAFLMIVPSESLSQVGEVQRFNKEAKVLTHMIGWARCQNLDDL